LYSPPFAPADGGFFLCFIFESVKTLISVIGPTGIGKTALAIGLAQHFGTEIVSCDARQFFREMKIGTAAPTTEELAEAPHHFIGNLSVKDDYSLGKYEADALQKLDELFHRYDTVIMVGGSGMYEKAVTEGLDALPEANSRNIAELNHIFENEGIEPLRQLLKSLDPDYYAEVDKDNHRRLIRAIDVSRQTGRPYSQQLKQPKTRRDFRVVRIGLDAPREIVYDRINRRVDKMMEQGLLDEVNSLTEFRHKTALQTVGYTELFRYLDGEWDLEFAISEIKKNSRRYAKRQMTWNRKLPDVQWLGYDYDDEELKNCISGLTGF